MGRLVKPIDFRGAVVNVTIGPTRQQTRFRTAKGLPRVTPSTFPALLDTGANVSAIEPFVVRALQLPAVDVVAVHTPTSGEGKVDRGLFEVSLSFVEPSVELISELMTVIGCDTLAVSGYLMLIGRDVLDRCEFLYDGPRGEFTLTF